jgi:hypothetical protein
MAEKSFELFSMVMARTVQDFLLVAEKVPTRAPPRP